VITLSWDTKWFRSGTRNTPEFKSAEIDKKNWGRLGNGGTVCPKRKYYEHDQGKSHRREEKFGSMMRRIKNVQGVRKVTKQRQK